MDEAQIKACRRGIFPSKDLVNAILEWWGRFEHRIDFDDWLDRELAYMAKQVNRQYPDEASPYDIVEALRIVALGDVFARQAQEYLIGNGFDVDVECSVEDNGSGSTVFTNIELSNKYPDITIEYSDIVAKRFNELGYSTEIWVSEDDNRCATVNCQLDLKGYIKNITEPWRLSRRALGANAKSRR